MEKGTWQQEWGCNGGTATSLRARGSGGDFLADVQNPISSATLFLHRQRRRPVRPLLRLHLFSLLQTVQPRSKPLSLMVPSSLLFLSYGDANRVNLRSREFVSGFAGVCKPRNHRSSDISQIRCREGDPITTAADLVRPDRVTDHGDLCERRFQISGYIAEKIAIRSWHPSHERLNETCKPQLVECLDYGHMGHNSSCMPHWYTRIIFNLQSGYLIVESITDHACCCRWSLSQDGTRSDVVVVGSNFSLLQTGGEEDDPLGNLGEDRVNF